MSTYSWEIHESNHQHRERMSKVGSPLPAVKGTFRLESMGDFFYPTIGTPFIPHYELQATDWATQRPDHGFTPRSSDVSPWKRRGERVG